MSSFGENATYRPHKNVFLSGNFAPLPAESGVHESLPLARGEIPADLRGEFVRNGPNPQFIPQGHYHWFDGDGMLHGVRLFEGGKVTYVNRFVRTKRFEAEQHAGKEVFLKLGALLQPGFAPALSIMWEKMKRMFGFIPKIRQLESGTANTSVVWQGNRLLALVESALPFHVRILADGDFESQGFLTYKGDAGRVPVSAHAKPRSGRLYNIAYQLDRQPYGAFTVIGTDGDTAEAFLDLQLSKPVMMHDFGLADRWAVCCDLPLVFDPMAASRRGDIPIFFDRERRSSFGVFRCEPGAATDSTTDVQWFDDDPCFMFHVAATWAETESGDESTCLDTDDVIVLVGCRFAEFSLSLKSLAEPSEKPQLWEWRFDRRSGKVESRPLLTEDFCEFPRVNPHVDGRRPRYIYASTTRGDGVCFGGLVKYDVQQRCAVASVQLPENLECGEWVFVAREGAVDEDDGYLLTFVYDNKNDTSSFYVCSAKNPSADPLAEVTLPHRIPLGFHGVWVRESELGEQQSS